MKRDIPLTLDLPAIQDAFRKVYEELDKLAGTKNIDLHGRRITNAGSAVDDNDYVTKADLDAAVAP